IATPGPLMRLVDPDMSLLIQSVRQINEKLKMPKGGRLKPDEIEALAAWVKAGAIWPAFAATKPSAATVGKPASADANTPSSNKPAPKPYVITPEQRAFWSFQPLRK